MATDYTHTALLALANLSSGPHVMDVATIAAEAIDLDDDVRGDEAVTDADVAGYTAALEGLIAEGLVERHTVAGTAVFHLTPKGLGILTEAGAVDGVQTE